MLSRLQIKPNRTSEFSAYSKVDIRAGDNRFESIRCLVEFDLSGRLYKADASSACLLVKLALIDRAVL